MANAGRDGEGRYQQHWISSDPGAATGIGASFYDIYQDPQEHNPHLVPLIHTLGQFKMMRARHELMKEQFPDKPHGRGVPLTGLSNARPETLAISERLESNFSELPFTVQDFLSREPTFQMMEFDWGN